MRSEQEIFDELGALCKSPGYAHAVAYLCFRDNSVRYRNKLGAKEYARLYSPERLIRTEISTLIGLMVRSPIDLNMPSQDDLERLIERSEALLKELHRAMEQPFTKNITEILSDPKIDPFDSAEAMREPIFYAAESAYGFQYRDFAPRKYARDVQWLQAKKGFTVEEARGIVVGIADFINNKLHATLKGLKHLPPDKWTVLDGFTFSANDISAITAYSTETIKAVVNAFSFPNDGNPQFTSLNGFNATNAFPIVKRDDEQYIVFQYVSLSEAIYDTPFYWMMADITYRSSAMGNRGLFTEEFAADRFERVFGTKNVFRNIDIWESKGKKIEPASRI